MFMSPIVGNRRNLFSDFNRMQNELESIFNAVSSKSPELDFGLDVWDSGDQLVITAELPGVEAENITTTVDANHLIIEADRKDIFEDSENGNYLRRERKIGKSVRSFRLPYDVENNKISAEYKHGVLTVTLPKAESCKPKVIKVESV